MSAVSLFTDVESIQKAQETKLRAWQIASSVLVVLFLCIASFLCYYGVSESNRLANDAMAARDASWTQEHVASSLSPVVLEKLSEHGDIGSIVKNEEQATYDDVKTVWRSRGVTYPVSGNISPEQGSVEFLDMKNGFTPSPSCDDTSTADSNLTVGDTDNSFISSIQ